MALIQRILTVPHSGEVAAVTSRDLNSPGARFCKDRGIPVFQTVDDLLDYGKFEVVLNPPPIHMHFPITRKCLSADFPVWLEKPPVATIQELDELEVMAESVGKPIAVCFNTLFSYLAQNLKKELLAGRFGRVLRVKGIGAWIRTSDYFNRNTWAGCLKMGTDWILDGDINNPFAHVLCNNLFFAAAGHHQLAQPTSVEAELYRCNPIESEDNSCLRIETADGVDVMSFLSLSPKEEIPPCTIIETEKAVITFENFERIQIEFADGTTEVTEAFQENRIEMIQSLCRSFRTGEPYLSTLEMIRPFTVTVNGAFESAGTIQTIPPDSVEVSKVAGADHHSIKGIEKILREACESNSLFSEMGVPWARKNEKFDTTDYARFPIRFQLDRS